MRLLKHLISGLLLVSVAFHSFGLTIGSWNIEFLDDDSARDISLRSNADYQSLAGYFTASNIDVLGFQEVANEQSLKHVIGSDYTIEMSQRAKQGVYDNNDKKWRQYTGFAIKKEISYQRHPDLNLDTTGRGRLRNGVDITLYPTTDKAIRVLVVHMKSKCFEPKYKADKPKDCDTWRKQADIINDWIAQRAKENAEYMIIGDFNRRFQKIGLTPLSDIEIPSKALGESQCLSKNKYGSIKKYKDYIDHLLISKSLRDSVIDYRQTLFSKKDVKARKLSDHCPISLELDI